jgi:hypothetical protein
MRSFLSKMPIKATTVDLLAPLAFNSPTSPLLFTGEAKWSISAAFDPPAASPRRDLMALLIRRAMIWRVDPDGRCGGTLESDIVVRYGDMVSKMMEVSLMTSARKRNVFVSGYSDVPK